MIRRNISTSVVGGEELFRDGLRQLLEGTELTVTRSAPSVSALLADLAAAKPPTDPPELVLLLDLPRDDDAFVAAIGTLKRQYPDVKLVVLSAEATADRLAAGLELGIHGFLLRTISREALVQSVALVMLGENVLPTRLTMALMANQGMTRPIRPVPPIELPLTPREREILSALVEGHPNKIIGRRLGVTEATVKVQVRRLMRKIGVENRTQAAIWALERGFPQVAMNGENRWRSGDHRSAALRPAAN